MAGSIPQSPMQHQIMMSPSDYQMTFYNGAPRAPSKKPRSELYNGPIAPFQGFAQQQVAAAAAQAAVADIFGSASSFESIISGIFPLAATPKSDGSYQLCQHGHGMSVDSAPRTPEDQIVQYPGFVPARNLSPVRNEGSALDPSRVFAYMQPHNPDSPVRYQEAYTDRMGLGYGFPGQAAWQ